MAETDTVRRILVSGRSEGLDKLSSELNKVRDAHDGVAAAAETSATVTERSAKRQLNAQGAWDRQIARADAAVRAQQQFDRELSVAARAFDNTKVGVEAYGAEIERLQRRLEAVGGTLARGSPGLDAFLGVGRDPKNRDDTIATFEAQTRELQAAAERRAALLKKPLENINKLITELPVQTGGKGPAERSYEVFAAQMDKTAAAVQRLKQQFDPLTVAEERHAEAVAESNRLEKAGELSMKSRDTIIANSTKILNDTKKAYEGAFTAQNKFGTGAGLARHELINLSRQVQDIGVSLASGQSFLTVLIQQGTQVADIFASSRGSVGGFLSELPGMLRAVVPAAGVAAVAIAALGAVYAAISVSQEKSTLSRSLLGAGSASGLGGGELDGLAKQAAVAADITVTSARLIAAEFVKLGTIAQTSIPRMTQVVKQFSIVTGQDLTESAQELSKALADPSKASETLSGKIGALDAATQAAIRTALTYNDVMRAQKYALEGVAQATDGAAESQSKLDRLKAGIGRAGNAILQGVAEVLVTDPVSVQRQEELNRLLAERAGLEKQVNGIASQGRTARLAELDASIAVIQTQLNGEKQLSDIKQKNSQQTRDIAKGDAEAQKFITGQTVEDMQKSYNIASAGVTALKAKIKDLSASPDTNTDELAGLRAQLDVQERAVKRQITLTNDYQKLRAEGRKETDLDADKAQKELDIRARFAGKVEEADKAEMARLLSLNSQRGTMADLKERERNAQVEFNKVLGEGNQQRAAQSTQIQNSVTDLGKEEQAYRRLGDSAGQLAKLRAQADRDVKGTAEDNPVGRETRFMELLQEARAQVTAETEKGNAKQRESLVTGRAVLDQAIARKQSEIEISRSLDMQTKQRELATKLRAAGVPEPEIVKRVQELTSAKEAEVAVDKERAGLGIIYGQAETIAGLEKEIALVGQSKDARSAEIEMLRMRQRLAEQGIDAGSAQGKEILSNTEKIIGLNKQLSNQNRLQQQLRQGMDFAADSLKSFVEDLLTGTDGINGALKSLGKSFLSASLDALISGKGPLAGITGLASTDKDSPGGALGALAKSVGTLGKKVEDGAKAGVKIGVGEAVQGAANTDILGGLGISNKDLAGGLTAIAGLAGAYGAGASAGSYAQAVGGGAVSGGMAGLALAGTGIGASLGGAAVLGPIGIIIGAGLAYWGQKSAREAAKKQREAEAQENYRQAAPGIDVLRSQLRGEPQDTLENRIKNTLTEVTKGIDVAFFAKKTAEATALADDFGTYKWKAIEDFQRAFGGLIDSLEDGLGPNSAFSQARDSVKSTGDSLKGFVSDAAYAFGKESVQVQQATEAARTHALSILDGAKSLSLVETRMEEIRGAGAALQQLLVELGMSATDAAAAIEKDTIAALKRLTETFQNDINAQVNDAQGYGYVNDFNALFAEIAQKMADATKLGLDTTNIQELFRGKAQDIVDGAQLTGEAFDRLIAGFPQLAGIIVEFTDGLKGAAKEADIAARKLAYLDRLFAATNDSSTLEGQLAAYNRTAQRERQEEIRKGGQALSELDAAQAAERYNIIKDWNDKILDDQKRAAEEASNFWDRIAKQIKQYTDGLRAGSESPLSPQQRLAAAQAQYNAQLALAQTGDRDALSGITGYHKDFLDAFRDFWGSSETFQQMFEDSIAQLEALPEQVRPEDLIIDAIEDGTQQTVSAIQMMQQVLKASVDSGSAQQVAIALSGYFTSLDTNTDNLLSTAEFLSGLGPLATQSEQTAARNIFSAIDQNGDGQIDKQEQIRAASFNTASALVGPGGNTAKLLAEVSNNTSGTATQVSIGNSSLRTIDTSTKDIPAYIGFLAYLDDIYAETQRTGTNTKLQAARIYVQGNSGAQSGFYFDGGYTGNFGTRQEAGIVHGQEYVLRAEATRRIGIPALDYMNDNMSLPEVAMPSLRGSNDNTLMLAMLDRMDAMVDETRAARSENSRGHTQTARATLAGANQVTEGVEDLNATQAEAAREARRKRVA